MKHFKILVWFDLPQVKWYKKTSTKSNIVYEFLNDWTLKIRKLWEKTQKWDEAEPSTQSPSSKKFWYQRSRITQKKISKLFVLCSFTWFLDIVSLILSAIVSYKNKRYCKKWECNMRHRCKVKKSSKSRNDQRTIISVSL